MLEPDRRQILLEDLQPPPGHTLDAAVATTFTLSLDAALIPALAFSSMRLNEETRDPVVLLESIKRISDRVDVFCQAGHVSIPKRRNDLYAFLEPMLHQVAPPAGGLFHPKLWFLRFVDADGERRHRLLVLSRNLTSDATWDVVVRLDSQAFSSVPIPGNRPLAELIRGLSATAIPPLSSERATRVASLGDDAERIEWELPSGTDSLEFHTTFSRELWTSPRVLAVSPFVDEAGLSLVRGNRETYLVSRPQQLDSLPVGARRGLHTFVINPAAGDRPHSVDEAAENISSDAETSETPLEPSGLTADLHAKFYVVEPQRANWTNCLVLFGSANATYNGLHRNVELLVGFHGHKKRVGVDAMLGALTGGKDGALEKFLDPYSPGDPPDEDPDEETLRALENWLRSVAAAAHQVKVHPDGAGLHRLELGSEHSYSHKPAWEVSVGLLTLPGKEQTLRSPGGLSVTFDGVGTPDISPYVTVRVSDPSGVSASTVLIAELVGDPADRFDQVLARQINTQEKFLRLLHLLLGLIDITTFVDAELTAPGSQWGDVTAQNAGGELELILNALAHAPESLAPIDDLVRRLASTDLGKAVLPEGFESLWHEVRQVLPKDGFR